MPRLLLLSLFALSLTARAAQSGGQPLPPLVQDTTPIALFNGKNFDGLHIYAENPADANAAWKVEDGLLRCLGVGRGYVRTTTPYADYKLHLEWRWSGRPGNSGVFLNVVGADRIWPKCIEAQLAINHVGDFALFSDARSKEEIVSRNPYGFSTGRLNRTPTEQIEKPAGEWNTYDIVVSGDTITLTVNGVLANRFTAVQPSAGMIAFENEGTSIDLRNITLTPLPAAKELNAPMPR